MRPNTYKGQQVKLVRFRGTEVWRAETVLADLAVAVGTDGPAVTDGSQTWTSAEVWDLTGCKTLTGTLATDASVGFWSGSSGVVNSQTATAALRLADGTVVALEVGQIALDLSGYTAEQLASVQLQGTLSWSLNDVTNSAFYGGWSISAVGSP